MCGARPNSITVALRGANTMLVSPAPCGPAAVSARCGWEFNATDDDLCGPEGVQLRLEPVPVQRAATEHLACMH